VLLCGESGCGKTTLTRLITAIASERDIIVLDEPTSGLDLTHMREVADAVRRLLSLGKTVFIITTTHGTCRGGLFPCDFILSFLVE
jgi:energy-coupling factor transport system ATP-binding protein